MISSSARRLLGTFLVAGSLVLSTSAAANEAPTAPGNLSAIAVSSTEIQLSWDPSLDDRRVKTYELSRDGVQIAISRKTTYADTGLKPDTTYVYELVASDGLLLSPVSSYTVSTPATDPTNNTDIPQSSDKPGKGNGKGNSGGSGGDGTTTDGSTTDGSTTGGTTTDGSTTDGSTTGGTTTDGSTTDGSTTGGTTTGGSTTDGATTGGTTTDGSTTDGSTTGGATTDGSTTDGSTTGGSGSGNPSVSSGAPEGWQLTFDEGFDGDGDLDIGTATSNWRFETMADGLHRAGNTGIDALGNPTASWGSVAGKRWSAWYDSFNHANAYRENGELIMGGYFSAEVDPTRPIDYMDEGVLTQYGSSKLYTSWIDTFSRKWVGPGDLHVMDPASPGKLFKYGYVEMRVNFSGMMTPGFRLSTWLMPASNDAAGQDLVVSSAYDSDGNNGLEIDLFEYEWINTDFENRINLAVIGGAAGNSATNFDAGSLGINLHEGYHTIGFLWEPDRMAWTIDGHLVKEVVDVDLIPDVYSYLVISREMNSGVKNPDLDHVTSTDMLEEWPYIPRDPGLYAKNIWEFRDRINTDRAVVDYIRVWQP